MKWCKTHLPPGTTFNEEMSLHFLVRLKSQAQPSKIIQNITQYPKEYKSSWADFAASYHKPRLNPEEERFFKQKKLILNSSILSESEDQLYSFLGE